MAAKPNGEPFIDVIFFGTHYCSMYRWDDTHRWVILTDEKKCRRLFGGPSEAYNETMRILMARRKIRAERAEDADPLGVESWRTKKAQEAVAERARVFGTAGPGTIFMRGGRQVEVVTKQRRARA